MFPGLHPMAAHHHPQPHPHSHPGLPHPLAPPHSVLQARGLAPTPQPSPAHTHPPTSTQNLIHQALHVPLVQPLSISQEELDMILYGYAKSHNGDQCHGHALSGLNLTQAAAHQAAGDASSPEPVTFGIAIIQTTFAGSVHYGVFCTKTVIARGSRFGPFKGRIIHTSEIKTHDDNSYMWEIFQDGKLSHFIDGRGAAGNWMAHVKCARYAQEQNLIAVQADGAIWYEACKDIPQGTELLVWYGDCYLQFMGVPVALKEMADGGAQEEADTSEGFQCERCGKVFAYKYYRDKHLKYTRCVDQGDRKYPCTLCSRSFEKRDRLRIHILHVHEKHRPHKCMVCGKSFSQSSSLNKHMRPFELKFHMSSHMNQ
nr:hypothetical protein BaRGS_028134 [Batillaria attramentaria]